MHSPSKHTQYLSKVTLVGLFATLFSQTTQVSAQISNPAIKELGSADNVTAAESGSLFAGYFVSLWSSVISLGAVAVLIYFVWGSFEWITAGGDSAKTDKARQRITNAMLGLFILVSTFVIINFMSFLFFGDEFQILRITFPGASTGL